MSVDWRATYPLFREEHAGILRRVMRGQRPAFAELVEPAALAPPVRPRRNWWRRPEPVYLVQLEDGSDQVVAELRGGLLVLVPQRRPAVGLITVTAD